VNSVTPLPDEGDFEEARRLAAERPVRLPSYRLERIHVSVLNVDYAPPHGNGYARPLSAHRLKELREQWDPLAVSPLTISRRNDSTLWVIDGNHRRVVAFEKGMLQLPAMVQTGRERATEADLYTKLGTVLGQTPWTRFLAKLAAGNETAHDIIKIAQRHGFVIDGMVGKRDGHIQAVSRTEWIYGRGGPEGLSWVFAFLNAAFSGERESIGEMQLEGVFGFYVRYGDLVHRDEVAQVLGAGGVNAWHDRAASIYNRVDIGPRSNTYGLAIAEVINDAWRKQGKKVKDLLPTWERSLGHFGSRYRDVPRGSHISPWLKADANPTPQQLGA
jgi:hypothetical protein